MTRLDPENEEKQISIILVTHDPSLAEIAQRTVKLIDGKLANS